MVWDGPPWFRFGFSSKSRGHEKVGGHYTITHAPFEVVEYEDYVEMGLMFWRDLPRDVYDYDEKPPHPELNFTEVTL